MEPLLHDAVAVAVRAPSGHNTQPWRFRAVPGAVEVLADRTRALPVVDPDDRALTISCGAAVAYLEIALRAGGHAVEVEVAPGGSGEAPDLLARVSVAAAAGTGSPEDAALLEEVPRRITKRVAFEAGPLREGLVPALAAVAKAHGVWLAAVGEPDGRRELAELVAEGDRRQYADRAFREELARWVRHPRHGDGLPPHASGSPDPFAPVGRLLLRTFDLGGRQASQDQELAEHSPLLAVMGTRDDGVGEWVQTGRALGRLLLAARREGVDAAFLNQPIEVPDLRPRLAATIGRAGERPQLLLRLGHGPDMAPSPRRPLAEVLV